MGGFATKKVAIYGYYGHSNFGDDVILDGLKQLFRGWQVTVMSDNDRSTCPIIDFGLVNECDLFVLGGGELINTDSLFSRNSILSRSWVQRIKIPKVILGCGVNAENAGQLSRGVVKDLEGFSYIGLRDTASVNILRGIPQLKPKVHLFHDPSFSINTFAMNRDNQTNNAVVIPTDRHNNKHDAGIQYFDLIERTQHWLVDKLYKYEQVTFLAFGQQDNDDYATSQFLTRFSHHWKIIPYSQLSIPRVLQILSECSLSISYRLHGLILSFIAGAKYEFYPYHRKLQRVHDTISGLTVDEIRNIQQRTVEEILEEVN